MTKNSFAKCSPEALKIISEQRKEKKENSFLGKLNAARKDRKEEMSRCREAEVIMTDEIVESTKALKMVDPSTPAYSAAADNIEKLGKTVDKLNTKRSADKKLIIPIVGSVALTGAIYAAEKIGRITLTGGLKDFGRKIISIPASFIRHDK